MTTESYSEAFALRAAAQQARRIVDHFPDASLDFRRHWRGCAIWLEKRAAAVERGDDPDLRDDPAGEVFGPETPIFLPGESDWLLNRTLEARKPDGCVAARWRYNGNGWTCTEGREKGAGPGIKGWSDLFEEVVAGCIKHEWSLMVLAPVGAQAAQGC